MIGGIISTAGGVLGGVLGGIGRNSALRKQLRALEAQQRENQNWYDRRYNEDATQRADAQELLRRTEEAYKERVRSADAAQAVSGATAESVAQQKATAAEGVANATAQIAAQNERRKDQIEAQYRQRNSELEAQKARLRGEKASVLDIAAGAMAGAAEGAEEFF